MAQHKAANKVGVQNNPKSDRRIECRESRKKATYIQGHAMVTLHPPLAGQPFLIVDALLLVFILVSGHPYCPTKKPLWRNAIFGLCWSVIVLASAIIQRLP